jgi:hypothetical protein
MTTISSLPAGTASQDSDLYPSTQGGTTYKFTRAQILNGLMRAANNLSDLTNTATAITNLGLGPLVTLQIGTGLTSSGGNLLVDTSTVMTFAGGTFTGYVGFLVASNVSAAGTVQGDATLLAAQYNVITTVGSGAGVILPASITNKPIKIRNNGANALKIYPNSGAAINGLSANAAATLGINTSVEIIATSGTQWYTF